MSDTKEIIEYVRGCINGVQKVTFGKDTVKSLLNVLEQAEARAEQAEARVKSRNNHIHRLLGEALENERNLDGMKSRWQTAEAENERLTKERDWLAKALAEDGCPYLALWSDFGSEMRPDWCICIDTADDGFDCNGDPKECWKKEAARKAVAVEGK